MSVRFVGDRLSRYANAKGEVSMAVRVVPAETLSEVLWHAGLLLPRTEETTP